MISYLDMIQKQSVFKGHRIKVKQKFSNTEYITYLKRKNIFISLFYKAKVNQKLDLNIV